MTRMSRYVSITLSVSSNTDNTQPPTVTPVTPSQPAKRHIPATPTQRSPRSHKKARVSGLESLAQSMNSFGEVIANAFAPSGSGPDTPRRRQQALKQAQKVEKSWLTGSQLLSLVHILQKDDKAVETYAVLEDELRVAWVCDQLNIEVPIHWSDSD